MIHVLAYIPAISPELAGLKCEARNADFWRGEVERYPVITVHKNVPAKLRDAIIKAYADEGINAVPWDEAIPSHRTANTMPTLPFDPDAVPEWDGQDVVIIGGGPSLKGFDIRRLRNFPCKIIGVNRAYELIDPDILFGMDTRFFDWAYTGHFGEAIQKQYLSLTCKIMAGVDTQPSDPRVQRIPRNGSITLSRTFKDGIFVNGNSGFGALNLALMMGAKRVYLLGYDCITGKSSETTNHWHDGYNDGQRAGVYSRFASSFREYADQFKERAEIINVNRESGISCFPFGDLPDGAYATPATPAPPKRKPKQKPRSKKRRVKT